MFIRLEENNNPKRLGEAREDSKKFTRSSPALENSRGSSPLLGEARRRSEKLVESRGCLSEVVDASSLLLTTALPLSLSISFFLSQS